MLDLWDNLGKSLNHLISEHENNNVGYATTQMFASGGAVTDPENNDPGGAMGVTNTAMRAALAQEKTAALGGSPEYNIFGGKETNYFSSPEGITARIMNGWHNFFQGERANPGGTNAPMQKPTKNKPVQSENPTDFYARWYNRMREFAQAEEVADRGQSQVRTR